jgi:crossover junction endodeoxyribonuclease RuvC
MKVIGIDPGLAATGIGIVSGCASLIESCAYGSIETSGEFSLPERLKRIYDELSSLLTEQKPSLLVIEDVFVLQQYPRSAITLGQVCGVVMLACQQAGIRMVPVPVREAKQVLTGNGNARKDQLERAVRRVLKLSEPVRPFHASDALGLAIIGLYRYFRNAPQAGLPGGGGAA